MIQIYIESYESGVDWITMLDEEVNRDLINVVGTNVRILSFMLTIADVDQIYIASRGIYLFLQISLKMREFSMIKFSVSLKILIKICLAAITSLGLYFPLNYADIYNKIDHEI